MKWLFAVALLLFFGNKVSGRQHVIKGTLSMSGEEPVVKTIEEAVIDAAFTCPPRLPCPVQEEKDTACICPEQNICPVAKECPAMECETVSCAACPAPSELDNCDSWKYACGGTSMLVVALAVSILAMLGKPSSSSTSDKDNKGGKPDKNTKILLLEKDDLIATQQQKIAKLTTDLATEKNHNDNATKKAKTAVAAVKPNVATVVDHTERDALQQQIRELQAKNQQEKTKLDGQIRQLEGEKTELKNQLKKLSESMGMKDKEITDFNAQIKKQKEQMKEKDKEVTDSVKKLKEQIDKLKTEVVEKTKNIGDKTTELGVKDKEMVKKDKAIVDLLAQLEREKNELARSNEEKIALIEHNNSLMMDEVKINHLLSTSDKPMDASEDSLDIAAMKELSASAKEIVRTLGQSESKAPPVSRGIAIGGGVGGGGVGDGGGGSNLSAINTELAAQVMNLTKEFQSYKDTADKIIADCEARITGGVNPSGGNSPTNKLPPLKSQFVLDQKDGGNGGGGGGKGVRSRSPACDVKRGATRLAKLGLEDLDEVAALKKQLADLLEKSNLLAAHLHHAKFLASRAVHTTAELQAQNVELKQELLSISSEFEMYKENCTLTLSEYERKHIKDGEVMAALQLELKDMDKIIDELRSQLAAQAQSQDKGSDRGLAPTVSFSQEVTERDDRGRDDLINQLKDQLAALVAEYQAFKTTAGEALAFANTNLQTVQREYDGHLTGCQEAARKVEKEFEESRKQMNDQMTALVKEYQSYKTTSENTIVDLNAQHLKECKMAAQKAAKRIADLETANKQLKDQMSALAQEYQTYKIASEKTTVDLNDSKLAAKKAARTIADLETASWKLKNEYAALTKEHTESTASELVANKRISDLTAQLASLATEYQSFKVTSAQSLTESNASKKEYAQHLKECKLAAEKAAKSVADLETANKQLKDQMSALAQEYQTYKIASEKTVADHEIQQKQNAKSIELLEAQGKKDAENASITLAALTVSNKRVSELEGQLASQTVADKASESELELKLTALAAEYQAYKARSEATIKELTSQLASLEAVQRQVVDMTKLRDILIEEKRILLVNYDDLSKELEALRSDHDQLQEHTRAAIDTHKDEKAMLNKLIAENTREIKALLPYKSELNTVKSELTASNADLAESKDQLMTLALEFQAYKGKADQHISNLEQLLKSKEQMQMTQQGGHAEQRVAELEAQLAGESKTAVSEFSALMKRLAETTAAADTAQSTAQQRISDLEQQLERQGLADERQGLADERQGLADKESLFKLLERERELETQLSTMRDQMMGLAREYKAYKDETGGNDEQQSTTSSSDVLLQQRLTDLQRQYALLEAQNTEMRRKLWTMEKAAEDGRKNEEPSGATKDSLTASRDVQDVQSLSSDHAENQSLLSATAEDYNQTEFASSAPSSSPKSRQPTSTQSAMYDLRKQGTSTAGSVAGTAGTSSSSVGSGVHFPNPTPNNTPSKSIVDSTASDPIGTFFNMFGHGSG